MNYDPKEYFEAIFQLRNPREEILEFIDRELAAKKVIIAGRRDYSNGMDLYLSSQHAAQNIGKRLYETFGGELKITKRLFSKSRQTSKDIYRVTIYYMPNDFIVGDVIKTGKRVIQIKSISKKNITGIDLLSNKKTAMQLKGDIEILNVKKAVVSKTYPNLEVIHPDTYQSVAVKNPKKIDKKEVKVAIDEEDVYCL